MSKNVFFVEKNNKHNCFLLFFPPMNVNNKISKNGKLVGTIKTAMTQ